MLGSTAGTGNDLKLERSTGCPFCSNLTGCVGLSTLVPLSGWSWAPICTKALRFCSRERGAVTLTWQASAEFPHSA